MKHARTAQANQPQPWPARLAKGSLQMHNQHGTLGHRGYSVQLAII